MDRLLPAEDGDTLRNALTRSEAQYRTLVETLPHGVQECDTQGVITFANEAHARMYCCEIEQLIGRHIWDLVADEVKQRELRELLAVLVRDQPAPTPYVSTDRRWDGWLIDVQVDWDYKRDEKGALLGFVSILTDVTGREERFRRSESKYRSLIEGAKDMIFRMSIPEGRYEYVSPAAEHVIGYPAERLLAEPLFIEKAIHPESRAFFEREWARLQEGHVEPRYEYRIVDAEDRERWISQSNVGIHDASGRLIAIEGVCRDDTERRRTELDLQRSEARLKEAQRIAKFGFWDWDIVEEQLFWSDEIYKIFGIDRDRFGATYEAFLKAVHPEDRPAVEGAVQAALQEAVPYCMDHRVVLGDGQVRVVHEEAEVIRDEARRPIRMVGTVTDITERCAASERIQRLQNELAHATRVSLLGEIAASIAHELHQPLASVANSAYVAARQVEAAEHAGDELATLLKEIEEQSVRAGDILQRLRRLAAKTPSPRSVECLNALLREAMTLIKADLQSNRVTVRLDLAEGLPRVEVDGVQVQQVMLNVIRNAVEALKSVERADRALIVRTTLTKQNGVRLAFRDTGPGVPAEVRPRLFQPFFTTKPQGMGMGLSISRSIIESHLGRMWLETPAEGGTVVYVELPAQPRKPIAESAGHSWSADESARTH